MRLFLLALFVGIGFAQDPQSSALHKTLVELRAQSPDEGTMGATPRLTVAKHQLRDWIETQLATRKESGDEKEFAARINGSAEADQRWRT